MFVFKLLFFLSFGAFLNFSLIDAKIYSMCELALELKNLHSIPIDEIYKHICIIGDIRHTDNKRPGFLGLYRIGSEW